MADQTGHVVAPPEKEAAPEAIAAPETASLPAAVEDSKPQETESMVAASISALPQATTPAAAVSEEAKPKEAAPVTVASDETEPQEVAPVTAAVDDLKAEDTAPVIAASEETKPQEDAPVTAATGDPEAEEYIEDIPDPDEDDLDDLDDMLEEFSAAKIDPKPKAPPAAAPGPSPPKPASAAATAEDGFSEEDFAKQLQAGMAELLGEMETSPEMKAQFEQFESIFKELGAADVATEPQASKAGSASSQGAKGAGGTSSSFQDNIRRTMERMQASGESATAAATADSQAADNLMAEMLKHMQASGGGGLGEGNEEEFSKMLLGMMEQLTNKEILYEPMKELHDKFPEWLEKNKGTVSEEDLKRYKEQQRLAGEIVAKFEEKSYADSNTADREYIVDRMQKMQAEGSPPTDLVGDMPSAQEALGAPDDEACNPQ